MPRPTTTWALPCKARDRLAEAIACYRRALELKPDYAEAHNNLGTTLQAQGKLAEAIACYRRALELKPDYAEAHNNLGTALQAQGKLDEAIACYRRALELKPDFAEAHNNLGNCPAGPGKAGGGDRLLPAGPAAETGLCRGPQQLGQSLSCKARKARRSQATATDRRFSSSRNTLRPTGIKGCSCSCRATSSRAGPSTNGAGT